MKSRPRVVIAGSENRRSGLFHHLRSMDVEVLIAASCQQVRKLLGTSRVDLVITGITLADGNWSDIIRHVVDDSRPVNVIVTAARPTDSLWAEVFWRGAYDLLIEPCQANEVRHVVANALRAAKSLAGDQAHDAAAKVAPGREVPSPQPIAGPAQFSLIAS